MAAARGGPIYVIRTVEVVTGALSSLQTRIVGSACFPSFVLSVLVVVVSLWRRKVREVREDDGDGAGAEDGSKCSVCLAERRRHT